MILNNSFFKAKGKKTQTLENKQILSGELEILNDCFVSLSKGLLIKLRERTNHGIVDCYCCRCCDKLSLLPKTRDNAHIKTVLTHPGHGSLNGPNLNGA